MNIGKFFRYFAILLLFIDIVTITGCGWHLYQSTRIPDQMKKLIFDSSNLNSSLSYAIRNQLLLHGVQLIEKSSLYQEIPLFRITQSTLVQDTASIFQNGNTAEYQIIMILIGSISIPNNNTYPFKVKVYHSFVNNSQTKLETYAKKQFIVNEVYKKAAEELIKKLINIQIMNKKIKH